MITATSPLCSVWPQIFSSSSRLCFLKPSGLDSAWSVKHFSSAATGNLFGPMPSLCAGSGTASLQRSSHFNPYMKTHAVIKALLIPHGMHSCAMLLRRSSSPCWEWVGVWLTVRDCILEGVCICDYVYSMWGLVDVCGWVCCQTFKQQTRRGIGLETMNNQKAADYHHGTDRLV